MNISSMIGATFISSNKKNPKAMLINFRKKIPLQCLFDRLRLSILGKNPKTTLIYDYGYWRD